MLPVKAVDIGLDPDANEVSRRLDALRRSCVPIKQSGLESNFFFPHSKGE